MRTTLNLDEDVLLATKEVAERYNISISKAVSNLLRLALVRQAEEVSVRNGVPLFPVKDNAAVVTLELVNRLRDDIP